jgi:hypothetical protein
MNRAFAVISVLLATAGLQSQNFQWAAAFSGSQSDWATGIASDAAGNAYATGIYYGTSDFDPGPSNYFMTSNGSADIFVAKLSPSGQFRWSRSLGGSFNESAAHIDTDSQQNIYVTGLFEGTVDFDPGPGSYTLNATSAFSSGNVFILKLDSSGNFLWARSLVTQSSAKAVSVKADASGNCFILGGFGASTDFDPGVSTHTVQPKSMDCFLLKLDASGNFVWVRTFEGGCYGESFDIDNSGSLYVTGSFQDTLDVDPGPGAFKLASAGARDAFIVKLDIGGSYVWGKRIGPITQSNETAFGSVIGVDAAMNVYVSGFYQGNVDFDPGTGLATLPYVMGYDLYVLKLDPQGNFIWTRGVSGNGNEEPNGMHVETGGRMHITGIFSGVPDFDPGSGVQSLTSNGSYDLFYLSLDASGNYQSAFNLGGTSLDFGTGIVRSQTGAIFIAGAYYSPSMDFDPSASTFTMSTAGSEDAFIVKLACPGVAGQIQGPTVACNVGNLTYSTAPVPGVTGFVWQVPAGTTYTASTNHMTLTALSPFITGNVMVTPTSSCGGGTPASISVTISANACVGLKEISDLRAAIYPNPNSGRFIFDTPGGGLVQVFDAAGKRMAEILVHQGSNELDFDSLPAGIYCLTFSRNGQHFSEKFVKQ